MLTTDFYFIYMCVPEKTDLQSNLQLFTQLSLFTDISVYRKSKENMN